MPRFLYPQNAGVEEEEMADLFMLEEVCQYLKNWFDRGQPKIIRRHDGFYASLIGHNGESFCILIDDVGVKDGMVASPIFTNHIQDGQYYRIVGSTFNDGVYCYKAGEPDARLTDEPVLPAGAAIWLMAIPKGFIALVDQIAQWQAEYGVVGSAAMSPYNSESFGGYSYSKSGGGASSSNGGTQAGTWQAAFAARLSRWRKI